MFGEIRQSSTIKEGPFFRLARVVFEDGRTLLAKSSFGANAIDEEKWLQNEYRLFDRLNVDWTLRPVGLSRLGDRAVAFYRDADTELRPSVRRDFTVEDFIAHTRELCALLDAVHRQDLLLLGMTPNSFLRRAGSQTMVLTDALFAHSTRAARELDSQPYWAVPYLRYAAPEIVSRSVRKPDQRADMYSLGAVLYEWIAGRPPFESHDPAELIQCHLAKEPPPLDRTKLSVPDSIVEAVSQLLSKEPQSRPNNSAAFLKQLERHIASRSTARAGSRRARFRVSSRLYGRDEILRRLSDRLNTSRTVSSITFIDGAAGMGKTTLLRALRDQRAHEPGHFCSGRFHYAVDEAPLSSWASALGQLADAILTKERAELERWRNAISSSLGEWAPLITVIVPQWHAILGDATPKQSENADASINRLALAIHRLLRCFAEVDGSVTLVLDDLQYADASSLRILELVLTAPEPINLLVVATVRMDHEAAEDNLLALRERLIDADVDLQALTLQPLTAAHVRALFEDSLHAGIEDMGGLSELALAQTGGSPLFLREFLAVLIERGVLWFDELDDRWRWSRRGIQALPVGDDVSQFLANKISGLPDEVRTTLRLAACLGIEFSLGDYSATFDMSEPQVAVYLEQAVAAGLLRSHAQTSPPGAASLSAATELSEVDASGAILYEFVHDRVFEASRALNSVADSESLHLRIGRVLSSKLLARAGSLSEISRVARHFNAARRLVTSDAEALRCSRWNLEVANAAKLIGAYSQALDAARAAMDFLCCGPEHPADARESAWSKHFELTVALHETTAEAALLHGQLPLMNELCSAGLARLDSPYRKLVFYDLRISAFKAEGRFSDAVGAALEILSELGVRFPKRPGVVDILIGYVRTKRRLLATGLSTLRDLAPLQDPVNIATGRIIHAVYPAAYLGSPNLFPLLVYRHVGDSIRHGNSALSAVTYTGFAAVLCVMGDFDRALALGQLGLDLLARFDATHLKARVYSVFYFLLFPWKNALHDSTAFLLEGIQAGLEHGDIEFSCYMMNMGSMARLHSGGRLSALEEEFGRHRDKIASLGHGRSLVMQNLLCQLVADLRTGTPARKRLGGPFYDLEQMLPRCMEPLDANMVLNNHLSQLMLAVFFDDPATAYESAVRGRVYGARAAFGAYVGATWIFYESLAYLAQPARRFGGLLRRVGRNQRQLKQWAKHGPMNFLHKYHLVEAERCRALGRDQLAGKHYELAIELGEKHGYLHEVALAQELAGKHYLARKLDRMGRHYLREAFQSYLAWGATAKIQLLQNTYPELFDAAMQSRSERSHGGAILVEALDYRAVLNSSQAISGEILLPRLLHKLLRTIMEHAGAQRGVLLLEERGELHVEIESDIDSPESLMTQREHLEDTLRVPRGVVHYAARMERPVVLGNAVLEGSFTRDAYVVKNQPCSVLCTPILHQGRLIGLVYLENNRMSYVFNSERLEVIHLLASQAAISIANARYHALQLEAQQAKINPHFLFNALSSIADLTVHDGKTAEQAIVNLASLYRYILTSSATTMVTLEQELQVVRKYLSLEKLRFGSKLDFRVTDDGNAAMVYLPGLLIQPLAENAIRHSIAPRVGPGVVTVEAHIDEDMCCITVQDDGDGTKHATGGTGFGLRSVQERLSLVYGSRYSFAISRADGYRVELEIPLQTSGGMS